MIDEEVFSVHDEANSGPSSPEISKKTVSATKAFGKDAAKDFVKGTSSSLFASKKAADKDVVECLQQFLVALFGAWERLVGTIMVGTADTGKLKKWWQDCERDVTLHDIEKIIPVL